MTTVLAQGVFDVLHPGHVHYLAEAAQRGDTLHVIVARRESVSHKPEPILPNEQRTKMVEALKPVDQACVGHPSDIFAPLEDIRPDVLVVGHDQPHDEAALASQLAERGFDCRVERASKCPKDCPDEIHASSSIIERILRTRRPARKAQSVAAVPWSH